MAVRLKDVAAAAGVSVKTVSNVVNNQPHISASTRLKVENAITELGYRPNVSARQLRHGRGGFLALALPSLAVPYFAELAEKISIEAERAGHLMLLDTTNANLESERLVLDGMRTHVVDGVIFSHLAVTAEEIAARRDSLPIVLLGERAVPDGFDHVAIDSIAAAKAMTMHLAERGHRRIAVIGREGRKGTSSVRLMGFRQGLKASGLSYLPELSRPVTGYEHEDGRRAMAHLLSLPSRPDAVFCFNDVLALGAIRACADAGVRVPHDIAIAGFDNIAASSYATPTLTTIAPDTDMLAREAVRLVLERATHRRTDAERVKVPWQLIARESTLGSGLPEPALAK